jgi:hypothetical protein
VSFDLAWLDEAVNRRTSAWQQWGWTWTIRRSPEYPKGSAWVDIESDPGHSMAHFCVWETGEADLDSITGGVRVVAKHYELENAADLDVALGELDGVLTGDSPRPADSRTYTRLDDTRLGRRVRRDFPGGDLAGGVLRRLEWLDADLDLGQGTERVQAAAVFVARGDLVRLEEALAQARLDWRDLLVAAGLGHSNWAMILDKELGV